MLCEAWLGYSRLEVALNPSEEISSEKKEKFLNAINRLRQFEPIQYIIGHTEFYGLGLKVTTDTLIPRPETEELVEWILSQPKEHKRILDIGTGSGCIAIALAKNLKDSDVSAIDISEWALDIARQNAADNNVVIQFFKEDILKSATLPHRYDLIVSNPPYVRALEKKAMQPNVLNHEPALALYVSDHEPLLFYEKIGALARKHLEPDGMLFFEINEYLSEELVEMLTSMGFTNIEIKKDFRGKARMIKCIHGAAIK